MNIIKNISNSITNFIAPRNCEICDTYLGNSERRFEFICDKCYDNLPLAPTADEIFNKLIQSFEGDDLAISNSYALFSIKEDHDYMKPIYALKYIGFSRTAVELGRELGRLVKMESDIKYDYLVPVPIHHARKRERGYNQSEYIAIGIEEILNKPLSSKIIKRKRYTQTQTQLSKEQRKTNITNSITPVKNHIDIQNKTILLIDDVLTTGSTLNVCANKLLEMGAKRVEAATLVVA